MSTEGLRPVELTQFGGLQTVQGSQTKVPQGKSPLNQNVRFSVGGRVQTREGVSNRASFGAGAPVVGIKEYVDLAQNRRLLTLLGDGSLRYETGAYSFSTIATNVVAAGVAPGLRLSSTTLFGKEWVCFGASAIYGSNPAKVFYYDPGSGNTFFDPVAPEGPGSAPTVATSATAGNVSVGSHSFAVFFRTRSGYWTQLGPTVTLSVVTASRSLDVSNIPVGPAYVTERVIVATPAFSNNFFFNEGTTMVIKDNTSTTALVDFTDTALTNGTPVTHPTDPAQDLLRQIVLPPPASVAHYSGRLAYWGWRHQYVSNGGVGFPNMRFQGGWASATVPNGWTQKIAGWTHPGGQTGSFYGDPARITGTGAQAGCFENAGQWNKFIPAGVEVWVRVRAKRSASLTGTLCVYPSDSGTAAATIPAGSAQMNVATSFSSTEWAVVSVRMLTAAQNTGWLATTRLRVSTGNGVVGTAFNNAQTLDIDYIEVYTPGYDGDNLTSLIRWSKINNPEAFDGLYCPMLVEAENGEPITACFTQRGNFYICKERSMFVTQDNGATEPVDWTVENISTKIGTPSRFGVGQGDGWSLIVARSGLYLFDGGKPVKISQEIDPTWQRINFTTMTAGGVPGPAQGIWCVVDTDLRRAYIGVPMDGVTTNNKIIVLEWDGDDTPSSVDVRNYTIWDVGSVLRLHSAGFSVRSTGASAMLIGLSGGQIVQVDATATSDNVDGATDLAINSIYRLAFLGGGKRTYLGKIIADIAGAGALTVKTYGPDASTSKTAVPAQNLAANPNKWMEWNHEHIGEHVGIEFSTNTTGAGFQLDGVVAWVGDPESGEVRSHAS